MPEAAIPGAEAYPWGPTAEPEAFVIDAAHLARQRAFSLATFGPGPRKAGVIDHIRKELIEVEEAESPEQVAAEWVDVVILALDGLHRTGVPVQEALDMIRAKQERNEARGWPDWRTADPHKAIEHVHTPATSDEADDQTTTPGVISIDIMPDMSAWERATQLRETGGA